MELKLIPETDLILKTPCVPWDWTLDPKPENLSIEMLKVMFANNGIGLSAPQVGLNKRIFVMGTSEKSYVCINPEIISHQGEIKDIEGCLSYPGLFLHVKRYETIEVKYQNILGEEKIKTFNGIISRVFQHELDHLNGVCFVNRVGKLSLEMAQQRRKKNLK
jgi:peptide deformylase